MAPLQDTPSIKSHFSALIRVEKGYIALASGILKYQNEKNNMAEFMFEQVNPIPSYLMAILAGVLEKRSINERTYVYAEKDLINKSVEVLSDIGRFLDIV